MGFYVLFNSHCHNSTSPHDNIKSFLHLIFIAALHINIASCSYICLNTSIVGTTPVLFSPVSVSVIARIHDTLDLMV